MRTGNLAIVFLFIAQLFMAAPGNTQTISLAGKWKFAVDPSDLGIKEKWYEQTLTDVITLPGSMAENRKGNDITLQTAWTGSIYDSSFFFRPSLAKYRQPGHIKIPFWLNPVKHYVGVAWYQKEINIPANWKSKSVLLFLERSHIQTSVWIDNLAIGKNNSLVAPHELLLPAAVTPGKHILTIRVDNRINEVNVGPDSHSVSDHTQGNWNGIVGRLLLKAIPALSLNNVQVYPDITNRKATVRIRIINRGSANISATLLLKTGSFNSTTKHTLAPVTIKAALKANDTTTAEATLSFENKMLLWDEFDPALYRLTTIIKSAEGSDTSDVQFGMRELKTTGNKLTLNGRTIHLRGDLNNCVFPLTGYAPMDKASWKKVFLLSKAYGLNHMRFHSWCPPEAAFLAADETGFYLQPEGPTWPNHGTSLGDGRFIDRYLYEETDRILKAYGNHPSFCFMAGGNEPAGRNQARYLDDYVQYWRAKDNRRLYTGASVAMSWPLYPASDFMIKSGPRGLNWNSVRPETTTDYAAAIEKFTLPYVTHEMGQWCVFPDFKEIKKYTGVNRAGNFELFREDLGDHGMADKAEAFFMASGKLQALCYKNEIEKSLRTKNSAGFQLLGLQDFPGQGSALIGVVNALGEGKNYITANQWKRFCNSTVPLSRIEKFTFTNNDTFRAAVELYHYGKEDLKKAVVRWSIKEENGKTVKQGVFPSLIIRTGMNTLLGEVSFSLASFTKAAKLNFTVSVDNSPFMNDWDFWVYPQSLEELKPVVFAPAPDAANEIYYTDTLDLQAEELLNKGGIVFLHAAGKIKKGREVIQYFTPVFWNTSWFKMRPPHTLGILLDPKHPAFAAFPTAYHSEMQWWELVNRCQVMHLEDFPKGFQPLVQPIDTWFMNRKLGLIIEAKVGKGRLIVSSADLITDNTHRVVARQLRYSLQRYMMSAQFTPASQVDISVIRDLFISPSKEVWDSFTKATPDELKPQTQKKP